MIKIITPLLFMEEGGYKNNESDTCIYKLNKEAGGDDHFCYLAFYLPLNDD